MVPGMECDGGPECHDGMFVFRFADPDRRLAGVRLAQHAGLNGVDFEHVDGAWCLTTPRPPIQRLEYLFELRHHDGGTELVCDPHNPLRVGGAFGDKSVMECPGYTPPYWLSLPGAEGSWHELTLPAPGIRAHVGVRVWSPAVPTGRILLAHDGPEYDRIGGLVHYSTALQGSGRLPPHHLVLVDPGDRNEWYSASPAYSWTFASDILPRVYAELGTTEPVVGMGASLGGLAMLHAQRRFPAAFAGLFLQSGSFFVPRHDRQESGFRRWLRIVRFTGRVHRADDGPSVPTVLTCGTVEENLPNNRQMARTLARQGYPVELHEVPDAHNYTGWRDAFDPYLTGLLLRVWAPEATV